MTTLPLNRDQRAASSCILIGRSACRDTCGKIVMLGSHWDTSPVLSSLPMCCFAEATSIVSVVLVSHIQDSAANIKKERKEKPWHVPGFLLWVSCVPSYHLAGTAGHWGDSASLSAGQQLLRCLGHSACSRNSEFCWFHD